MAIVNVIECDADLSDMECLRGGMLMDRTENEPNRMQEDEGRGQCD